MVQKQSGEAGKKKRRILSDFVLLVCAVTFCFAVWKLWGMYQGYHGGEKEYEELRRYVTEDESRDDHPAGGEKRRDRCPVKVDFDALRKINPRIRGWLYIPHSQISYPIVQGEDNEHYLNYTFEEKKNFTGAIFLDALCRPDFQSDNSIIYGHNLKSGEMFGHLKRYYDTRFNEKADFRERPVIWVITPDREQEYRIFSAREISVQDDMEVYTYSFASPGDFRLYLDQAVEKSLYDTGVEPEPDRIVTLSTCTSASDDGRFIVQASLIQD